MSYPRHTGTRSDPDGLQSGHPRGNRPLRVETAHGAGCWARKQEGWLVELLMVSVSFCGQLMSSWAAGLTCYRRFLRIPALGIMAGLISTDASGILLQKLLYPARGLEYRDLRSWGRHCSHSSHAIPLTALRPSTSTSGRASAFRTWTRPRWPSGGR